MKKFYRDSFIGIAILGAGICLLLTLLLFVAPFVLALLLSGVSIPAVIVVAIAAATALRRPGLVVGPALILGVPFLGLHAYYYQSKLSLESLDRRDVLAPKQAHQTILIPSDGDECDSVCNQLLEQTDYSVAIGEPSHVRASFKNAQGNICYRPENLDGLLNFVRRGFADRCAIRTANPVISDALIFNRISRSSDEMDIFLPEDFDGSVRQLIERIDGKDRVLGQWVSGRIGWILKFDVGEPYEVYDIYNRTLGTHVTGDFGTGHDSLLARVKTLDPVIGGTYSDEEISAAASLYANLLGDLSKQLPDEATPRIARLLNSPSPELKRIGLQLSTLSSATSPQLIQQAIVEGLASDQAWLVITAFERLAELPPAERGTALPAAFTRAMAIAYASGKEQWSGMESEAKAAVKVIAGSAVAITPDLRAKARERFLPAAELSTAQWSILIAFLSFGEVEDRRATVDAIFALRSDYFARAILATGRSYGSALAEYEPNHTWSEDEFARLIVRSADVDADELDQYFKAIEDPARFKKFKAQIIDTLTVRSKIPGAEDAGQTLVDLWKFL